MFSCKPPEVDDSRSSIRRSKSSLVTAQRLKKIGTPPISTVDQLSHIHCENGTVTYKVFANAHVSPRTACL